MVFIATLKSLKYNFLGWLNEEKQSVIKLKNEENNRKTKLVIKITV